jgi:anaerobic magnesium-protoporphyrin IX monomethyl ester cyclase
MPRVALIFPYFRTHSATEMLFSPLGCASLASQLRRRGIQTRIFDCTFKTFEDLRQELTAYAPAIVGIYCMVTLSRNTFRIAQMVRGALPESLLVAGGPLPTLYPERFSGVFDLVFRGEADLSFPRFCRDLFDQGPPAEWIDLPLATYDGLYARQNGMEIDNPSVHFPEPEMESFPLPYRGDFDHAAYQNTWLELDGSKTTSLLTTLGCTFNCDFCSRPIFGNLFRRRNLDAVFAEIEQILSFGYDTLWIADDNFTLDVRFLKEFCRRITGLNIGWSCLSRVTGITAQIAGMMKAAGCRRVYLGLETGNAETLKLMKKQASLEQGQHAVRVFHEAGIQVAAFFIVGYPEETIESIEDTFRFALELPLDSISFNVPFPLPGSPLFDRLNTVDTSKDWDEENEVTFVYNSEFDSAWLERRIRETTQAFAEKTSRK